MLEGEQTKTKTIIQKLRDSIYETRLRECGLTTLETNRWRGDHIEVITTLNGFENIDTNIIFSVKEGLKTRG